MDTKNTDYRDYGMANSGTETCARESSDVFFDFEVRTEGDPRFGCFEPDHIPSYKEAFGFIAAVVREYTREYITPFNVLMVKVASIIMIAVLILGGTVASIVKTHIEDEKKKAAEIRAEAEAAEEARREEKRKKVMATCTEVLGRWYEMDPERDDIRTLFIEVDDDAKCVYTIGDETGGFTYKDGKLSLKDQADGKTRTLVLGEDRLSDEADGLSYYKTNAGISSLKFAEFLKNNLPGTYQEFLGDYLLIYPDGKWAIDSPWGFDESGTWSMEINEGSVLFIFEGMGIHYGGGNIYKVTEDEYESEKAEIASGDFSLVLDVNSYDRISGNLP